MKKKKDNSFKGFSVKESRIRGDVDQERFKMGYNCIMLALSHFLTLKMYSKSV